MRSTNGRNNILRSARDTFADKGFDGASIRDIAQTAGLSLSALYYYFPSKQEALYELVHTAYSWYIEHSRAVIAEVDDDPVDQLTVAVRYLARYRMENVSVSTVLLRDTERLTGDNATRVKDLQREAREVMGDIVQAGIDAGHFHVDSAALATRAIHSICNSLSLWYRPTGDLTPDDIERDFTQYTLRILGIDPSGEELDRLLALPVNQAGMLDFISADGK
ncbi:MULTISPECIES: TetR/AcrR family transcriptional regulator [unclassified Brevibacterium]|uniref:TetR/AcrR family transcriptional regulator n=1 Tax=unclassified Brevibacterium TaxID=2614124 RepID=UPI001BAC6B3E|nr:MULTISPECIES: TetR/AcrR family transcriptional regulator [unclassified Brevibacterium]QUL79206.1 TetR family transcriptional regulator [Brevibacterium sp. SMBL_HHYL_HB1]HJA61701.1 TetR/AcrR family transcriptional regulator [Candidatus Brevibacterium intestinavium]